MYSLRKLRNVYGKLFNQCPCHNTNYKISERCRKSSSFKADGESDSSEKVIYIRNFSIIAHVDHGKSTLADRLLEMTGAIVASSDNKQVLDRLQVEKERGITVKSVAATLNYTYAGQQYILNLIDTPGHVDFANEVSRSIAACQGVILLIDANEGVQAQTIANFYLAFTSELVIIPVLNKIDLKNAKPKQVEEQLKSVFDIDPSSVLRISAKTGIGVEELIKTVIERIPPPNVSTNSPFRARLIDSWFDRYRGAVLFVSVVGGKLKVGSEIRLMSSDKTYVTKTLGKLVPQEESINELSAGHVGVITCGMKNASEGVIGDTICLKGSDVEALPMLDPPKPMVFSGLFPTDQSQNVDLRSAIEKLCLNDPSVNVATESSPALGYGWRLGFLGLLHLDVFRQRLEQEYGAEVVLTAPSVTYKLKITGVKNLKKYRSDEIFISNPAHWPDPSIITEMYEPFVLATIIMPDKYLGPVMTLCMERRGVQQSSTYIDNERLLAKYVLPLSEVIVDFHDSLKSITSGYASFDYENIGYEKTELVKIDILLNSKIVEELSVIANKSQASLVARRIVTKLKEMIPRQMVTIAIQAVIGGNVLARETLKAFRKDVTSKLYGGDTTRRMKLVRAQNEGKKKMRMIANIQIPKDTFIDVLRRK